jgi:nitroreductase
MDAIHAILTRRSVRRYNDKEVSDKTIKKLIKAGFSAPSAGDQQPWHFIVLDYKQKIGKIQTFHPNATFLKEANKVILICADLNLEKFKNYWTLDCSAATQNILLATRALGLGSCWLGVYPRGDRIKNLKKLFGLTENIIPFSLISLGYSFEKQEKVDRYKKERIHYNTW